MESVPVWKKILGVAVAVWIIVGLVSVLGNRVDCSNPNNSQLNECASEEETTSEPGLCGDYTNDASLSYCMENQYEGGDYP